MQIASWIQACSNIFIILKLWLLSYITNKRDVFLSPNSETFLKLYYHLMLGDISVA